VSLPHARGGEPMPPGPRYCAGCVFPTHVGVNRRPTRPWRLEASSSPRTWG